MQVDVKHIRKPTAFLQWMGMNALIIYALAACDIFSALLQGFYKQSPQNNLVDGTESLLQAILHSEKWGTLAFVLVEIAFWGIVAGFLHRKGIYGQPRHVADLCIEFALQSSASGYAKYYVEIGIFLLAFAFEGKSSISDMAKMLSRYDNVFGERLVAVWSVECPLIIFGERFKTNRRKSFQ
ncbi:hypothetical protein AKJ16_DCAP26928 [Drosera capensis]